MQAKMHRSNENKTPLKQKQQQMPNSNKNNNEKNDIWKSTRWRWWLLLLGLRLSSSARAISHAYFNQTIRFFFWFLHFFSRRQSLSVHSVLVFQINRLGILSEIMMEQDNSWRNHHTHSAFMRLMQLPFSYPYRSFHQTRQCNA